MNTERALTPRSSSELTSPEGYPELAPETTGGSPAHKVHRVLRGRYRWAVLLGLILMVVGGYLGWSTGSKVYRSAGRIFYRKTMPSRRSPDGQVPLQGFEGIIAAQVELLRDERVANLARKSEEWEALDRHSALEAGEEFADSLTVEWPPRTSEIHIYFDDEDPEAAQIAVRSLIQAYREVAKEKDVLDDDELVKYVGQQVDYWDLEVKRIQAEILELTRPHDGPEAVNLRYANDVEQLLSVSEALGDVNRRSAALPTKYVDKTPEEISLDNESMTEILKKIRDAKSEVARLRAKGIGDGNKDMIDADDAVRHWQKERDDFAKAYNHQKRRELAAEIEQLQNEKEAVVQSRTDIHERMRVLGLVKTGVSRMETLLGHAERQLDSFRAHRDQLIYGSTGKGRMTVTSHGTLPTSPHRDKRKQLAVLFAMLGGALGVGVVVLLGLMDGRMRDTGDLRGWLGDRRVLGLIPDLSGETNTPIDEELALHCVQRIRTLIEIDFLPEDLRALCVTGPNAGAGKSTLTMCLGASLCATGAQTLLIDFDLTGRGLTRKVASHLIRRIRRSLASTLQTVDVSGNGLHPDLMDLLKPGNGGAALSSEIRDLVQEVVLGANITERIGQEIVTWLANLLNLVPGEADLDSILAAEGDRLLALGCVWDGTRNAFVSTWAESPPPADHSDLDKDLTPYLVETGIPNLQFLRLGKLGRQKPRELSNSAVAAVIQAARKSYPIVLVDTGPVLGSLDSSFVAAQSDVVILAIHRGEQREFANKALAYLDEIGANLGGLVLNRATVKDARITSYTYSYGGGRESRGGGMKTGAVRTGVKKRTLWGLSPQQLHDRFWAARGVQVVRHGERSEIVTGADLFLLTDPRLMVRFPLFELVETLSWLQPDLLVLRIGDVRDRGYREEVVTDKEDRFNRFQRKYGGPDTRMARVALATDPDIARRWQNSLSTRDGWRMLRRQIPRSLQATRLVEGYVYDGTDPSEVMDCLRGLMDRWTSPDATIRRADAVRGGIWADSTAEVDTDASTVGRLWIGAGRSLSGDEPIIGPEILWDSPLVRPEAEEIRWLELEPMRVRDAPPRVGRPGLLRRTTKRVFDILFSILVLAFTLPLYPFIALAILIEDGWPIFFAHRRETLGGREFSCIKFRSMRRDADRIKADLEKENQADGPQFFIENDPRHTRVGQFLRNTQLDEIPQFLNVLLGQMSVVGPRPSPYSENQFCPGWREGRLSVRPGITGLWQIKRTRQKGLDFQEWIRFDLEYVERSSLRLDLWIVWQTLLLLVRGKES